MRANLTFSMKEDTGSVIAAPAETRLRELGFRRHGLRTYEVTGQPQAEVIGSIREFLDLLEVPDAPGHVAHLWIYLDDSN